MLLSFYGSARITYTVLSSNTVHYHAASIHSLCHINSLNFKRKNQPRHRLLDWLANFCFTRYIYIYNAAADTDRVHTVRQNFPAMMKVPRRRVTPIQFHPWIGTLIQSNTNCQFGPSRCAIATSNLKIYFASAHYCIPSHLRDAGFSWINL
jgi:hypothetical protein